MEASLSLAHLLVCYARAELSHVFLDSRQSQEEARRSLSAVLEALHKGRRRSRSSVTVLFLWTSLVAQSHVSSVQHT